MFSIPCKYLFRLDFNILHSASLFLDLDFYTPCDNGSRSTSRSLQVRILLCDHNFSSNPESSWSCHAYPWSYTWKTNKLSKIVNLSALFSMDFSVIKSDFSLIISNGHCCPYVRADILVTVAACTFKGDRSVFRQGSAHHVYQQQAFWLWSIVTDFKFNQRLKHVNHWYSLHR